MPVSDCFFFGIDGSEVTVQIHVEGAAGFLASPLVDTLEEYRDEVQVIACK